MKGELPEDMPDEIIDDLAKRIMEQKHKLPEDIQKKIQPSDIELYFKDKKIFDEFGWTGEFRLSAKHIIDFLIDKKIHQ